MNMNLAIEMPGHTEDPAPRTTDVRPVPRISIHAFCESPEFTATIEIATGDRRMARAHVNIHHGKITAATEFYQSTATPNLIIIETRLIGAQLDAALDAFAEVCDASTKVIVVGYVNDVDVYRGLNNRGISEYLVGPVDEMAMIQTISNLYADRTSQFGRAIAFIGGKGGAGSSMVAHNVAWAIAGHFDNDVMVADLDLAFGTAGLDFNQDPTQGIVEALGAPERLDDVFLDRLLSRCSDHLSLLAAPASLDWTYDLDERAVDQVIDVARNGFRRWSLICRMCGHRGVKKTLLTADEIVLTVEPDLANLRNAKNIVDLLRQERHTKRLSLGDLAELGLYRIDRLTGDDLDAVVEGKPSLDAAHDDVDRIGKPGNELVDTPPPKKIDHPARHAEEPGDEKTNRGEYRRAENPGNQKKACASGGADEKKGTARAIKSGLLDAKRQGRRFFRARSWPSVFVEPFQRLLNRLTPARRINTARICCHHHGVTFLNLVKALPGPVLGSIRPYKKT